MKRSADRDDSMEHGNQPAKTFRRQNPVSCQFCRSKKLRCDRAQPCANCFARRISCVPASGSTEISSHGQSQAQAQSHPINSPNSSAIGSEPRSIESRLNALEQAVFHRTSVPDQPETPEAIEDGTLSKTATWIEADAGTTHGPSYSPYLEDSAPSFQSPLPKDWTNVLTMIPQGPQTPLSYSEIATSLPSKDVAELLFDHYANKLNWVYHIIHVPTTRQQLLGIYASIEASQKPKTSHIAVVATILAVAVYFRSKLLGTAALRENERERCTKWSHLAQKALLETNHLTSPSLETMQATIIMTQFLPNYGQSTSFAADLTHTGHMLQLHKTDSGRNRKLREETRYDAVELEVKRRIWWYIAGTDWLLSFMSGPQYGTYVCNPNQMNVLPPSNLDDADLTPTKGAGRPMSEPTEMTYSIVKAQLATAIRELVDEASKSGLEVEEMGYDQILRFDRSFNEILDGLPWFYKIDEESRRKSASIDMERPYIAWQRNFIHFGFHTRLSRLHRPYLARGYKDPRYAYSRMICLRSARMVIEIEQQMRQLESGVNPDSARLWIVVHHVFVATVTLVMDYISHRDDPQAAERKREILNCYKTLERSQEDSAIAKRGLAHLKKVMKDWMMNKGGDQQGDRTADVVRNETSKHQMVHDNGMRVFESQPQSATNASISLAGDRLQEVPAQSEFTNWMGLDLVQDLWQDSFDFTGMTNDPQWELLFRDLESQPGIYS